MEFTHLHVHTEYSLLDGSNKIKEYVSRVKELGMTSAAITDHGVMFGVIDFYREALAQGIKPILGCEVYVANGSRFDKETTSKGEDRYYHLVLLAENQEGYQNLMKIVSRGFTEGYYYKPRVDYELLKQYHKGLIALSACLAGEVQRNLLRGMYEEAKEAAYRYRDIFGEGNFFLEMQDHGLKEQQLVNQQQIRLAKETNIPLVATNDVHYTYEEDEKPHDMLLCIQTGKKLSDEDRMRYEGGQYYVKSPEEMEELFPYAREALENTNRIAQRCNVTIEFGVTKLPRFHVPEGYTSWEYLNHLCFKGLQKRYQSLTETDFERVKERLEYELGVIQKMGYVDYFLIVWDFIKFAKDNQIMVGPGRGSAAGSLVSYTLGITTIDPLKYQLLFERFLNPERVSMPDIDVDFCYERRQEVIDYVVRTYGKDCVVQIVTFGTMAARGVIRDVGRVMDLPYALVDGVAKMVPQELKMTLKKALDMNPELKERYDNEAEIKELIDMAMRLEGLPRHTSMHAAGVVISQKAVEEYVPLALGSDGAVIAQFPMTTLEELGLLKMDFLGLRTLTVIQNAVHLVEDRGISLNMEEIDYDDPKVLAMIGTGKTDGIFQLESSGMKNFMKELQPDSLEEIIAGISLYRPGPMDFIPQYIKGKNHPEQVTYLCPELEPILQPTYGCIVYQEQVMRIVRDLAGYTLGRSDLLRRAMSKKKADVMEKERKNFVYGNEEEGVAGCINNGIKEEVAHQIYDEMIDFANYAFNKSHAAAYAVVSYQTAYLKCYYPVEFMAALMTSVMDNTTKVAEYIYASRQMGISILPPDINKGEGHFTVDQGQIRFGLRAIKSVGTPVIEAIVREREARGVFLNLQDFLERTVSHKVNKRAVEAFIKAGAFDSLGGTRLQYMTVYPQVLEQVVQNNKNAIQGQLSLFDVVDDAHKEVFAITLPPVGEYSKEQKYNLEKEVMGVYLTGHPLEEYEQAWKKNCTATALDFQRGEDQKLSFYEGATVIIGGMIAEKTIKYTRKGQVMAFVTLEDLLGTVEVIVFPREYEKYKEYLQEDQKVFLKGNVQEEDERDSKLILSSCMAFDEVPRELWIQFSSKEEYMKEEGSLQRRLRDIDGTDQVVVYCQQEKIMKRWPPYLSIHIGDELVSQLKELYGEDCVKVVQKTIEKKI